MKFQRILLIGYQRTSIFNGDFKQQYFAFERVWSASSTIDEGQPRSDEPSIFVEPSIPDEAIPQAQQSRLQRLLRQFIHFDSERRQEVQGQRPETVTQSGTSRTVQSSTEDCYVKKVVLTLNGV